MKPQTTMTTKQLKKRVSYLEDVNKRIQGSLETVRALIRFQHEINIDHDSNVVAKHGIEHLIQIIDFNVAAICIFSQDLMEINVEYVYPEKSKTEVEKEIELQIETGTFAWSIQQNAPVVIPSMHIQGETREILLHSLSSKYRIQGIFFGCLSIKSEEIHQETLDILTIALSNISLAMENTRLFGTIKLHNEILEKEVAERTNQLREAKDHAENVSRYKSEFLANMSHEIRTPMNSIIGFSEMLSETKLNREQTGFIGAISNSCKFLLELINDILDFSKLESGKTTIEQIDFDLNELVDSILNEMSLEARKKGLSLIKNMNSQLDDPAGNQPGNQPGNQSGNQPGNPALYVKCDPARLKQVLVNLLGNAIKFTNKGSVTFNCRIIDHDKQDHLAGPVFFFSVVDTGIGIPHEHQEIIFKGFTQADGGITRKFGGTGLGLSISSQLVELLGGTLKVKSPPEGRDSGCEFYFSLRLQPGMKQPEELKKLIDPVSIFKLNDREPLNILLVEDTEQNIFLITSLLKKQGHSVTVAKNGELGVEAAEKEYFDVILMDVQMPVMDGLNATNQIRKKGNAVPIIAMTAGAMKGDRENCLDAGMDEYISKPIKIRDLLPLMNRVIREKIEKSEEFAECFNQHRSRISINTMLSERNSKLSNLNHQKSVKSLLSEIQKKFSHFFDIKSALKRINYDEELFINIVSDFYSGAINFIDQIITAYKCDDMQMVQNLAHSLKGNAAAISASSVHSAAARLHDASKMRNTEELSGLINILDKELNSVLKIIDDNKEIFGIDHMARHHSRQAYDGGNTSVSADTALTILLKELLGHFDKCDPIRSGQCIEKVKQYCKDFNFHNEIANAEKAAADFDFETANGEINNILDILNKKSF